MFRELLVHVDGSDAGRRRVRFAASLATQVQARLTGLHVTPPVEVPVQFKPSLVDRAYGEIAVKLQSDARASEKIFREETGKRFLDVAWLAPPGNVAAEICERARYSDLVILGQYERQGPAERHPLPVAHSIIGACGRPVLVVPGGVSVFLLNKVAIVSDRRPASARAIHDALPLLRLARSVQIITVSPKLDAGRQNDMLKLRQYLINHDIRVDEHTIRIAGNAALTKVIDEGGYDLMVMGGSSRPVWINFLFGSVIQSTLLTSKIPLLVSR